MGGFDKLMQALADRLREQQGRHQGGSKWIGTAGTSPFGAFGYNPEGVRIGQDEGRHGRAVKVWDRREFRDLDDEVELGTRAIKVALRRLRRWAREGAAGRARPRPAPSAAPPSRAGSTSSPAPSAATRSRCCCSSTSAARWTRHVRPVEELFSAARAEFRHLEHFYFHNCLYEGVWRDNRRRWDAADPDARTCCTPTAPTGAW